ncbi:toluene tolerance protein [Pseudomonas solani]|uniref:toluene tolerance protein n=1 Tax=Pseudomonas solani TaxID=2731552 RepID=UPI003F4A8CD8
MMTPLSNKQFLSLRQNALLIEEDHCGEKVLELSDGSFLKLFRRKRLVTSELYRPYAERFAANASQLTELHIPCPKIIATYRIKSIKRTAVHYWPLPGSTLRQVLQSLECKEIEDTCHALGSFIAGLHDAGVYFRSLHLGNIVACEDDSFGLIDIADMKISAHPLSTGMRRRNFQHLFRYRKDIAALALGSAHLVDGYCQNLPHNDKQHFTELLNKLLHETNKTHVQQEQSQ